MHISVGQSLTKAAPQTYLYWLATSKLASSLSHSDSSGCVNGIFASKVIEASPRLPISSPAEYEADSVLILECSSNLFSWHQLEETLASPAAIYSTVLIANLKIISTSKWTAFSLQVHA